MRKHLSKLHKQRISKGNKGKIRTAETIEKLRISHLGIKYGPLSKEHKLKISKGLEGKKHNHHIDLDENNNVKSNKIILTKGQHNMIHRMMYHYVVKFHKELLTDYIKWFKKEVIQKGRYLK